MGMAADRTPRTGLVRSRSGISGSSRSSCIGSSGRWAMAFLAAGVLPALGAPARAALAARCRRPGASTMAAFAPSLSAPVAVGVGGLGSQCGGAPDRPYGDSRQRTRLFSSKPEDGPTQQQQQQQQQQQLRSVPYDVDVQSALSASGYKRPTVNWYPGHIAKAERLLSDTLRSVDVVVEVRDARAPKATAHPRVAEWSAGRPRVVVLTHVDSVPDAAVRSWKRSYDALGAGRWDAEVDGQVRNQALQGMRERGKYVDVVVSGPSKKSGGGAGKGKAIDRAVSAVEDVLFVDAKRGSGIHSINRSVLRAGSHVNERRSRRGLSDRPLRVGIIGYPNVGKSALINKILGRRRARTANTPGVTRSLQWIRVRTDDSRRSSRGKEFELLDSPGIIPANMEDQADALLLAACNSVGTNAYDNQGVAAYLLEHVKALHLMGRGDVTAPRWREECVRRYGFDPLVPVTAEEGGDGARLLTGEDMVFRVADRSCRGSPEDAARKILQDFRAGRWGPVSLQLAPESDEDEGQVKVDVRRGVAALGGLGDEMGRTAEERERADAEERDRRARAAVETARERGLELPPMVEQRAAGASSGRDDGGGDGEGDDRGGDGSSDQSAPEEEEIGKGLFDGW